MGPSTVGPSTVGPKAHGTVGPSTAALGTAALGEAGPNQTKIPVALKRNHQLVVFLMSAGIYYLVTLKIAQPKIYKKLKNLILISKISS